MLDWILKYKVRVPGAPKQAAADKRADAAAAAKPAADAAEQAADAPRPGSKTGKAGKSNKASAPEVPAAEWETRLQAAQGDDAALLALAQTASAPLPTKLAAVAALASEAAVKEAERALRDRDRRVHSLAKQRAHGMRAQRETRAKADGLIAAAEALKTEAQIPVNSAVELDRAWLALDAALLDPQQTAAFAALTADLSQLTRQRAEQEAALKRWAGDTQAATATLQQRCTAAANGDLPASLIAEVQAHAQALADTAPPGADSTPLWAPLQETLATAQAMQPRLLLLERLWAGAPESAPEAAPESTPETTSETAQDTPPAAPLDTAPENTEVAAPETAADAAPPPVAAVPPAITPAQLWQQLPPLAHTRLAALLEQRFEAWQAEQDAARQALRAARRTQAKEQQRALRSERADTLKSALETALPLAEASLAQGSVAETHKHLLAIDELLHAGAPAEALRTRIGALQDGYAELRGWQHWAGGRARDELTQEAVALATSCAPGPDGQLPKLQLKAHAERIENLRARWKELDSLGGASSRALWQRFDSALKTAYEPLAAQKAALSAAREQNLAQRQQLLGALEQVALPEPTADGAVAELRPVMAALDQFRIEWRRLGPLEHTVPHAARAPLAARLEAAQQRLQAPLDNSWQRAEQERRRLIEQAQALAPQAQAGARPGGIDIVGEVRALQQQWQQCAKALPLPRNAENTLWGQFRAALDAVFSAREAVFNARDAEFKAGAEERLAVITKLEALGEASAADTQRLLAETHAQWQRCGPAPRAQAAALDDRFWRAQEAAQRWLAGSQQRSWQNTCDALAAKLALCEAQERSGETAAATSAPGSPSPAEHTAAAWDSLQALPAAYEAALRQRAGLPLAAATPAPALASALRAPTLDGVLLQLEAAWNLPSPPDSAAARRDLQLQAMKAALETRRSSSNAAAADATPEQWLAEALRRPPQTPAQRERLGAVLASLRQHGPAPAQAGAPAAGRKTQRPR